MMAPLPPAFIRTCRRGEGRVSAPAVLARGLPLPRRGWQRWRRALWGLLSDIPGGRCHGDVRIATLRGTGAPLPLSPALLPLSGSRQCSVLWCCLHGSRAGAGSARRSAEHPRVSLAVPKALSGAATSSTLLAMSRAAATWLTRPLRSSPPAREGGRDMAFGLSSRALGTLRQLCACPALATGEAALPGAGRKRRTGLASSSGSHQYCMLASTSS